MILHAIGDKFQAMNRQLSNAEKLSAQYTAPTIEVQAENYLADKDNPPQLDSLDIFSATPIKT
jgi:transformation/transcription domain-associated protein